MFVVMGVQLTHPQSSSVMCGRGRVHDEKQRFMRITPCSPLRSLTVHHRSQLGISQRVKYTNHWGFSSCNLSYYLHG